MTTAACWIDRISTVSICVPNGLHAQVAIDALRPANMSWWRSDCAPALDDADRMIVIARARG